MPLELWSYEASPESRLVREALSGYGLPYVLYNAARGSPKRAYLAALSNGRGVPVLVDPNRDVVLQGAGTIRAYLRETYARSPVGAEPWTPKNRGRNADGRRESAEPARAKMA